MLKKKKCFILEMMIQKRNNQILKLKATRKSGFLIQFFRRKKFMLNFVLFLLVLMVVVSLITALVIEVVKKIVSEDSLKKVFKTLEIFSLVFTFMVAIITYLCFLLFAMPQIDLLKVVVAGILFVFACGCGSQVGYDKVIKTIKDIISLLGGSHAIQ